MFLSIVQQLLVCIGLVLVVKNTHEKYVKYIHLVTTVKHNKQMLANAGKIPSLQHD